MKKKKYIAIHLSAITIVLGWIINILFIGIYYGINLADKNTVLYKFCVYSLIILSLLFLSTLAFMIFTKTGKSYWKEYLKRKEINHELRINKQKNVLIENMDYETFPEYADKENFTIKSRFQSYGHYLTYSLFAVAAILNLAIICRDNIWESGFSSIHIILMLIMVTLFSFIFVYFYKLFVRRVCINQNGVTQKMFRRKKTFKWSSIKTIGISTNSRGYKEPFCYIYFSKRKIKGSICIEKYTKKKGMIILRYRPNVIHCIMKYWDGEIVNLSTKKSWLRYVKNL